MTSDDPTPATITSWRRHVAAGAAAAAGGLSVGDSEASERRRHEC